MKKLENLVPKKIKQARQAAGLTQGELADALGVTRALVTSIENSRSTLTLKHLEMLPDILNRPIEYFLGLDTGLTDDEAELLAWYRAMPAQAQGLILDFVQVAARRAQDFARGESADDPSKDDV